MTLPARFEAQAAIVTGGASGIGAATARRLAAEGARVMVADIDHDRGLAVAAEIGGVFEAVDVSEADQIERMIAAARASFGGIDILVNNAGIGGTGGTTTDIDPAIWRRVMAINIDAIFHACRFAIPLMRAAGRGVIVNTASISGLGGDYGFTAYNASKGAVVNYTRALALDHARDGIRVNAVCPGMIETPMIGAMDQMPELMQHWLSLIPLQRAGKPEDVAAAIAFLASADAAYITGAVIVVDGGITAGTGQPDIPGFQASR